MPGPAVWFTVASYAACYHGCHIYLCPASPEIAVAFLVESYERRSYASCINFIELFVLPVCSFWNWNVGVHAQVCGLFCVLFMILCGFVQAKALNLGVLPMIVPSAPRCGCHCFYLRCCQVFLRLLIVPLLLGGLSLVDQAIPRFRSFWISSVADNRKW